MARAHDGCLPEPGGVMNTYPWRLLRVYARGLGGGDGWRVASCPRLQMLIYREAVIHSQSSLPWQWGCTTPH